MIIRIVRMEFQEDKIEEFQGIFENSKHKIRNFPGCLHLELHRDKHSPWVRYTYSIWESEEKLNNYRYSELFASVWPQTKALFSAKPMAFSLEKIEEI
ncbi:MAG: antibiotic biosynthesis monooxygenase [Bacteroidetes bacterium]|nr:antibiotic biosynthesis monooxygenase [Bacteroidota bacterium]MCB0855898.1 antibiotic biosynthesis monooxygenase [Bacteroidota bacterium]